MNARSILAMGLSLLLSATSAHAINAAYAKKLERSGCTQTSELQGCDINKTKAENAKAGFVEDAPPDSKPASANPYAGNWVAKSTEGTTVATIRINAKENVWVNGKPVKARRSDGALVFRDGFITFTIQGDRRLKGEDHWADSDAKTQGPIVNE